MARCGCSGVACSCVLSAGEGILVGGAGTPSSPWVITATGTPPEGIPQANVTDLVPDLDLLLNPPACRVFNSVAESIPDSVDTILTFNSERYDTDTMHSTTVNPSRITFTTAGLYAFGIQVRWGSSAAGIRALTVSLNGVTALALVVTDVDTAAFHSQEAYGQYRFVAGDYIEVSALQNTGGALNIEAVGNVSPEFFAARLGSGF